MSGSGVWPFAARDAELRLVIEAVSDRARSGLILAGPAGVGKSRLAAEAVDVLDGRHAVFRVGGTAAASGIPFGAMSRLLPLRLPSADSVNLIGWAADEIIRQASGRPFILAVDDAHLLDPTSAALVHHLAHSRHGAMLATLRSGEPTPDAITSLWKDELVHRVQLEPLDRGEVGDLLGQVLGGHVESATTQRFWDLSRGVVLYLRELVIAAQQDGTLTPAHGMWSWRGHHSAPPRLQELIQARLGQLDEGERAALELVALAEPLGVDLLTRLSPRSAVESLEDKQLISVVADRSRLQVRCAHPLYGEAVRAACPTLRTRRRYRELAEALTATGARRRDDRLRLAIWRLESGVSQDSAALYAGSRLAWAAFDAELAVRLGSAALEAGGGVAAGIHLATILSFAERFEAAEAALATVWDQAGDDAQRTDLAMRRAHNLNWGMDQVEAADQLLDDVERVVSDPTLRLGVACLRMTFLGTRGEVARTVEICDRVLSNPAITGGQAAEATFTRSMALAQLGRCREAITAAREGLARQEEWQDLAPFTVPFFYYGLHWAHTNAGELDAAEAAIDEGYAQVGEDSSWHMAHQILVRCQGQTLRLRGRLTDAMAKAREGAAVGGSPWGVACHLGELAHSAAMAGDLETAREALDEAERSRVMSARIFQYSLDFGAIWVAAVSGENIRAIELACALADEARSSGLATALWKDELATRIELGPLTSEGVGEVLAGALGGRVDPATSRRAHHLSQGNVLYLRELVRSAQTTGGLKCDHELWTCDWNQVLAGSGDASRLHELIESAVGDLPREIRDVLEYVALGEPLGIDLLVQLAGLDAAEAAEERGLITVIEDERRRQARPAHPLYGELARARCPELRRRRRLSELVDLTEATGIRRREDLLRCAIWRLESGTVADPEPLVNAAALAWGVHDIELAVRLLRAAVDVSDDVDHALTLGVYLNHADRPQQAQEILMAARPRVVTDEQRSRLAYVLAFSMFWGLGRSDDALTLLEETAPAVTSPAARQQTQVIEASLRVFSGDLEMAASSLRGVLADPAHIGLEAQACGYLAFALCHTGDLAETSALSGRVLGRLEEWKDSAPESAVMLVLAQSLAHLSAGELDAAEGLAATVHATLAELGSWDMGISSAQAIVGRVYRFRGRVATAHEQCLQAAGRFGDRTGVFLPMILGELAHSAALTGNASGARAALVRADAHRTEAMRLIAHVIDLARPWVTWVYGGDRSPVELALETARTFRADGMLGYEADVLHDVVRFGAAPKAADRLHELAELIDGDLVGVRAAHAAAADGPALEEVSREFERLGCLLFAAEASAQGSQTYSASGRTAAARASAARASVLAGRCERARTPALAHLEAPVLTAREQEIARFAASGLTSRDISERLVVSVRTIDNHLQSVYHKLGIAGRSELAAVLGTDLST